MEPPPPLLDFRQAAFALRWLVLARMTLTAGSARQSRAAVKPFQLVLSRFAEAGVTQNLLTAAVR